LFKEEELRFFPLSFYEPAKSKFLAIPSKNGEMTDLVALNTFIM
jgi:hypothetical protein